MQNNFFCWIETIHVDIDTNCTVVIAVIICIRLIWSDEHWIGKDEELRESNSQILVPNKFFFSMANKICKKQMLAKNEVLNPGVFSQLSHFTYIIGDSTSCYHTQVVKYDKFVLLSTSLLWRTENENNWRCMYHYRWCPTLRNQCQQLRQDLELSLLRFKP